LFLCEKETEVFLADVDVIGHQVHLNCKEVNILDKDYTIPITMSNLSINNRVSSEKRNKGDKTLTYRP